VENSRGARKLARTPHANQKKKKGHGFILKSDFHNAFDSVLWKCLDEEIDGSHGLISAENRRIYYS